MLSLIDQAEAEILQDEANRPEPVANTISTTPPATAPTQPDVFWTHDERRLILPEAISGNLEGLEDDVATVLNMIDIQAEQLSSQGGQDSRESDLAYLDVLEMEQSIVTELTRQVADIYYAPDNSVNNCPSIEDIFQENLDKLSL